jgi:hypothetical protein
MIAAEYTHLAKDIEIQTFRICCSMKLRFIYSKGQNLQVDLTRSLSKIQIHWEISSNLCGLLRKPELYLGSGRSFFQDLHKEAEHVERVSRVQIVQVLDHAFGPLERLL